MYYRFKKTYFYAQCIYDCVIDTNNEDFTVRIIIITITVSLQKIQCVLHIEIPRRYVQNSYPYKIVCFIHILIWLHVRVHQENLLISV